jgi:hypothetical protein
LGIEVVNVGIRFPLQWKDDKRVTPVCLDNEGITIFEPTVEAHKAGAA